MDSNSNVFMPPKILVRHDVALKIHIIKALGPVEHVRPSGTSSASIQGVKRGAATRIELILNYLSVPSNACTCDEPDSIVAANRINVERFPHGATVVALPALYYRIPNGSRRWGGSRRTPLLARNTAASSRCFVLWGF